MHIYNFKLNGKLITKILFFIIGIIVTAYFLISTWKIYHNSFKVRDKVKEEKVISIDTSNYTNILKTVHENLDSYIGEKICCIGYVYRMYDFQDTEFVIARDMIISSDNKSVVVGFLCNCKDAKNIEENSWVEITGEIAKGNYHGDIPIIKIKNIKF